MVNEIPVFHTTRGPVNPLNKAATHSAPIILDAKPSLGHGHAATHNSVRGQGVPEAIVASTSRSPAQMIDIGFGMSDQKPGRTVVSPPFNGHHPSNTIDIGFGRGADIPQIDDVFGNWAPPTKPKGTVGIKPPVRIDPDHGTWESPPFLPPSGPAQPIRSRPGANDGPKIRPTVSKTTRYDMSFNPLIALAIISVILLFVFR